MNYENCLKITIKSLLLMEYLEDVSTEIDINEVLIFPKLKDLEIEVINFYLRSQSKEFVAVF